MEIPGYGSVALAGGDDISDSAELTEGQSGIVIVSFRTPPGLRGWLTNFGQAWDSAIDGYAQYSLRVNGAIIYPYFNLSIQNCPPEQAGLVPLPKAIPLDQLSLVEMIGNNVTGSGATGNIFGRLIAKYADPKEVYRP